MPFRQEGDRLVSDTANTEYRVDVTFQEVLKTLPDVFVPRSLILLGILTESITPAKGNTEEYIRTARENVHRAPTAEVPVETVRAIVWLLSEVRGSLDADRKETIGRLVTEANLNSPSSSVTETEKTEPSNASPTDKEKGTTAAEGGESVGGDTTDRASLTKREDGSTGGNSDVFTCKICAATFSSKTDLRAHSHQCDALTSPERHQCKYCKNRYISESALERHLEDCDEADRPSGDRHEKDHTAGSTTYECDQCGGHFDSPQRLIEHRRSHSKPQGKVSTASSKLVKRRATGAVVHFNANKGYGFIRSSDFLLLQGEDSDSSEDLFFHVSEYPGNTAKEGQQLQFDIRETDQGYEAVNISRNQVRRIERWDDTFASSRPRWGK